MTKEEKQEELTAAATAYFAMKTTLTDFEKNKSAIESRLKNHFYAIGISWKEWQEFIRDNYAEFTQEVS